MSTVIRAQSLTTFEVSSAGTHVRINTRDEQGQPGTLEMPVDCLSQLLMTLPRMIQTALQRRDGQSARLTYPMESFRLELGELDANGGQVYILTLKTDGAFEVSFTLKDNLLGVVAQTIIDQVLDSQRATLEPVLLNS